VRVVFLDSFPDHILRGGVRQASDPLLVGVAHEGFSRAGWVVPVYCASTRLGERKESPSLKEA